ncbi:MAG: succinate dehydrogenase, cytochrome b556 subunit [Cellulomonadaceae bacterium]|jgi:succinate dehydrogenase / fumarate reductase cytochrome b subunit|nr:succinate dehydrogenase, cytochrome b556 subunit [Cellulomonadaceae bacterium]
MATPQGKDTARAKPLTRLTGKLPGSLYRGGEGMWSWLLHRITAVAVFLFLLLHIADTATIRISPEAYNAVMGTYKNPVMGIGEATLVAAVVLHALNGIRLILVDSWTKGPKYQKVMLYVVIGLFAVIMAGFLPVHLRHVFGGH